MKKTVFSDIMLIALNALLGVGGLVLVGYGYSSGTGLQGLGLVLIFTSILSYVGIRFGIEQQEREARLPMGTGRPAQGLKAAS